MYDKNTDARRKAYKEYSNDRIPEDALNSQNVFTPYDLCYDIIRKLESKTDLIDKDILIFNLEFAEILIHDFGVSPERIAFWTDCDEKRKFAQLMYKGIKHHRVEFNRESIEIMKKNAKEKNKFDVVVGNPPYQANVKNTERKGGNVSCGNTIWEYFVKIALDIVREKGYICFVHPPRWRKPGSKDGLFPVFQKNNLLYLNINDKVSGKKVFGATTRYDWYILQKTGYEKSTIVVDESNEGKVCDISSLPFIPNSINVFNILSKICCEIEVGKSCPVIYSSSIYDPRKEWMSRIETGRFKNPCVHSIYQNKEIKFCYSRIKSKGHFGIPKVIFADNEKIHDVIIDFEGKYGLTCHSIGIEIDSESEGQKLRKAMLSDKFRDLIAATKWGNFQTDWKMFRYFKKDFWKEFV